MCFRRIIRAVCLLSSSVLISSCFQHSEHNDCSDKNWYQLGYEEGNAGETKRQFTEISDCDAKKKANRMTKYLQGWQEGNRLYCSEEKLFNLGASGKAYPNSCHRFRVELYDKWENGLLSHCSPEQGFHWGANGKILPTLCQGRVALKCQKNYALGLRQYCSENKGYQLGLKGEKQLVSCPEDTAGPFISAYQKGYERRVELAGLFGRVDELELQITKVHHEVTDINEKVATLQEENTVVDQVLQQESKQLVLLNTKQAEQNGQRLAESLPATMNSIEYLKKHIHQLKTRAQQIPQELQQLEQQKLRKQIELSSLEGHLDDLNQAKNVITAPA